MFVVCAPLTLEAFGSEMRPQGGVLYTVNNGYRHSRAGQHQQLQLMLLYYQFTNEVKIVIWYCACLAPGTNQFETSVVLRLFNTSCDSNIHRHSKR